MECYYVLDNFQQANEIVKKGELELPSRQLHSLRVRASAVYSHKMQYDYTKEMQVHLSKDILDYLLQGGFAIRSYFQVSQLIVTLLPECFLAVQVSYILNPDKLKSGISQLDLLETKHLAFLFRKPSVVVVNIEIETTVTASMQKTIIVSVEEILV